MTEAEYNQMVAWSSIYTDECGTPDSALRDVDNVLILEDDGDVIFTTEG